MAPPYTSAMFMDIDLQKSNTEIPEIFHALFAHYFEAKVGRGRSVGYSILPLHMSPPTFLKIFITWELEVDSQGFLEEQQLL